MKPFTSLEATRSGCWWRAFEHLKKKKKFARAAQREQIRSASRLHFIVVAGAVKKCSSSSPLAPRRSLCGNTAFDCNVFIGTFSLNKRVGAPCCDVPDGATRDVPASWITGLFGRGRKLAPDTPHIPWNISLRLVPWNPPSPTAP